MLVLESCGTRFLGTSCCSVVNDVEVKLKALRSMFRVICTLGKIYSTWAVVNALGAVAVGAPVIQNFQWTLHWSLFMSVLTCVPAASVFGSSWADWHRIFAQTKPSELIEYMVCLPAHRAVIGAWFAAWPMLLDWERPWKEWPICVSYGAMAGHLVGMVACFSFVLLHNRPVHVKGK